MGFVANFICFPTVQKFWKSIKVWQSYREFKGGNFFETQCRTWRTWFWTLEVAETAVLEADWSGLLLSVNEATPGAFGSSRTDILSGRFFFSFARIDDSRSGNGGISSRTVAWQQHYLHHYDHHQEPLSESQILSLYSKTPQIITLCHPGLTYHF